MDAYIDHNFLINCLNEKGWREIARDAVANRGVRFVLSPWSIYEIGDTTPARMDELLVIAEELSPSWILERVDLQLREFVVAWNDFWNGTKTPFSPIKSLEEVQASFMRYPLARMQRFTIRDYAGVWQRKEAESEADIEFRRQESISAANRVMFANGKLTTAAIREIRKRYVARQFVISRRVGRPAHEVYHFENLILGEKALSTLIWFFVEFGGMDELRAHRVEEALTFDQWRTDARLNPNRQLDRFHAVAALPYCDLFVTSDRELVKKMATIRSTLKFSIAQVISGAEFIERFK